MLRHKAVKLGYFCAHRPVDLPRRVAEHEGCHRDEGQHDEDAERKLHVFHKHHPDHAHEHEAAFEDVHDHARKHFVHGLAIVRDARHKPADRVLVEETDVQLHHVREDVVAQVVDDLLAHRGKNGGLRIGERHHREHREKIEAAEAQHARKVRRAHLFELREREPLAADLFIFRHEFIHRVTQDLRLIQFNRHKDQYDQKRKRKPPGIRFCIAKEPAVG